MDISYIITFLSVCQCKSMTAASSHLNISQQGVTKQIQALETNLKITLFNRTRTGVSLTEDGKKLKPYFEQLANDYNELLENINLCKDHNKVLKVGFAHGVSSAIGVQFIQEFKENYPKINIDIVEFYDEECFKLVENKKVDVAILVEKFSKKNLRCKCIYKDKPTALVNIKHTYAYTKKELYLQDLHNQPILIGSSDFTTRKEFDKICKKINVQPNIIYSASSVSSYINSVKDTPAIAIIFNFMVKYSDPKYTISMPIMDGPNYSVNICLPKNNTNKAAEAFFNFTNLYFKG